MSSQKVLVIGAGYFGRLLIDDLLRYTNCELVVASRRPLPDPRFASIRADLSDRGSLAQALCGGVKIAICAAGPFQEMPTTLVELCLERGIHYIDIADDRGFVRRVRSLALARTGIASAVCSGWSTVSALSGVLAGIAAEGMTSIDSIRIQMAPGNRGARQTATIASLLHSVGQPFKVFRNREWRRVIGWSESREFCFPSPVGARRGYLVDVPDHELFPDYFNAGTVEFRAGSEFRLMNGVLSLLKFTGRSWVGWSSMLQRTAASLSRIGHDWGAVGVEVVGSSRPTRSTTSRVSVVADSDGVRIAAMPGSIMAGLLLSGAEFRGLVSHTNWITGDRLREECAKRGFRLVLARPSHGEDL